MYDSIAGYTLFSGTLMVYKVFGIVVTGFGIVGFVISEWSFYLVYKDRLVIVSVVV